MSPLPTAYDNRSGGCSGPSPSGPPGSPDGPYMPYNQPHPYASISQTPTNHGIIPPAIQNPGPFPRNSGIPSPMGGNVPNDYHFGGQPGSLSSGPSTSGSHHPPAVDYNSGGWPGSLASGTSTFGSSPSDASLANAPPLAPEYPTAPIARRDASKVNFVTKYVRELCSSVLSYGLNEKVQVCITGNKWVIGIILGIGDLVSRMTLGKQLYLVEFASMGHREQGRFSDAQLRPL